MSVLSELRNLLPCLTKAEYKTAMYIIENGIPCIDMNLAQLSKAAGVSEASVIRLCRKAKYEGFTAMRLALAAERNNNFSQEQIAKGINSETKPEEIPMKVLARSIEALEDCVANGFDINEYLKALEAIKNADNIYIFGSANSYSVANDAMNKFVRIGKKAAALSDPHIQLMTVCSLTKKDVVIGISHSGETIQTVEAVNLSGMHGATTICITNNDDTPLANVSSIKLLTAGGEREFDTETMLSRILQLVVIDMLYLGLIFQDYTKNLRILKEQNKTLRKFKH